MNSALIIDDDPDFRALVGDVLRAQGWQIWDADNGEIGLELARERRPRIVICDLLMPRSNGFQVCRALRDDPHFVSTRIVVTTARAYDADRKAAFEAGADEYLTKPFDLKQFSALMEKLSVPAAAIPGSTTFFSKDEGSWVKFWGVRGSIATPGPSTVHYGGNTSCVEVRTKGQIIILDAGTGLRPLGRALTQEFKERPLALNILLSHTHWDHIQGLPFFQPLYQPNNRIRILGYEGARSGLFNVLSSQMESPYFPVGLKELPSNVEIEELRDMEFAVGDIHIESYFANHPGICVGYRISTPEGSIAFFPDNEPPHRLKHTSRNIESFDTARTAFVKTESRKLAEFIKNVDVLIVDSQYDAQEYERHRGWGHGCVDDVVQLAVEAGAKRLYLFHHDPDHDDSKINAMVEHARKLAAAVGSTIQIEAAMEGLKVQLAPKG
jgi:phosphoribosyl 1,2-cyclic phosphodiesterase/ActR/RegA family two-component response regulator